MWVHSTMEEYISHRGLVTEIMRLSAIGMRGKSDDSSVLQWVVQGHEEGEGY